MELWSLLRSVIDVIQNSKGTGRRRFGIFEGQRVSAGAREKVISHYVH